MLMFFEKITITHNAQRKKIDEYKLEDTLEHTYTKKYRIEGVLRHNGKKMIAYGDIAELSEIMKQAEKTLKTRKKRTINHKTINPLNGNARALHYLLKHTIDYLIKGKKNIG